MISKMTPLIAASVLALSASLALAQPAPQGGEQGGADQGGGPYGQMPTQQQMMQMCRRIYAERSHQLSDLQSALALNGSQQDAFSHWRDQVLDAARNMSQTCEQHVQMREPPDPLQRLDDEQQMLETTLHDLRAERQPLEALYDSLSPQQKQTFDEMDRGGPQRGPGGPQQGPGGPQ